eukprot:635671-Prymnesium_polylepis.1
MRGLCWRTLRFVGLESALTRSMWGGTTYRRKQARHSTHGCLLNTLHSTCKLQEQCTLKIPLAYIAPPPNAFKERLSREGYVIPVRRPPARKNGRNRTPHTRLSPRWVFSRVGSLVETPYTIPPDRVCPRAR